LGLAEGVKEGEGVRYQAAAQAVKRLGEAMPKDPERREFVSKLKPEMSTIQMRPHCVQKRKRSKLRE
jgi:hypothetical protein